MKRHICDEGLSQQPLLVLPYDRGLLLPILVPTTPRPRNPPRHSADWQKLASIVEARYGPQYMDAARYLRALSCQSAELQLTPLPWHAAAIDLRALSGQPYEPNEAVLAALSPSLPLRAIWRRGGPQA